MADEIIDLTRYMRRGPTTELPGGSMSLWGAEGERSRLALPLWRIIHLVGGDRGAILRAPAENAGRLEPFVVMDLGAEPARIVFSGAQVPAFGSEEGPSLVDLGTDGLAVFLGAREGFVWTLWIDGVTRREAPLAVGIREDVLFLAGECAGLLFLRDLAGPGSVGDGPLGSPAPRDPES